MNGEWARQLTEYRELLDAYLKLPPHPLPDEPGVYRPNNEDLAELRDRWPAIENILKRLDPGVLLFRPLDLADDPQALVVIDYGLAILARHGE